MSSDRLVFIADACADRDRIRRLAAERFARPVAEARYGALMQSMSGPAAAGQAVS